MKLKLTAMQKKIALAGIVALGTALGEVGYQLTQGSVHFTKALILGLLVGAFVRGLGAALSAIATAPPPPPQNE